MKHRAQKAAVPVRLSIRLLSVLCTLSLCCFLLPPARAVENTRDSGSTAMPKLTREEIVQLLTDNPQTMPEPVFDTEPSTAAPYTPGKVSDAVLQAAVNRLNALRRIAGLPAVALDDALCQSAQYGAVLVSASNFAHTPDQPGDMDSAFYTKGLEATSSSNLSAGRTPVGAVDGFMLDSDAGNVDRLGHRRWQLNPVMGKVGFGYAVTTRAYSRYVAEKVFDRSGSGCDYDFVGWPASGFFPSDSGAFSGDTAWSVTLNPNKYAVPVLSALTVTLQGGGRTWTLSGTGSYTPAGSGLYLNVDTGGYGVNNCIIFRPDGVDTYEGVYTVTIDGLKSRSGSPVTFSYQVDFFASEGYEAGTEPSPDPTPFAGTFSDVKSDDWFQLPVERAAEARLMLGNEDGSFRPNDNLTVGQALVIAHRYYSQGHDGALPQAAGPWYMPYYQYFVSSGVLSAGQFSEADLSRPATRFEVVSLLDSVLTDAYFTPVNTVPDGMIPDLSETDAYGPLIYKWYRAGIIFGDSTFRFNGDNNIRRSEVAVIVCRLANLMDPARAPGT